MIRIKNRIDNITVDDYYESIIKRFRNKIITPKNIAVNKNADDFDVEFLPNVNKQYTISFKKLITGTREEVMLVDGMDLYMDICRLHYCSKSSNGNNITESKFLERLYRSFPGEISRSYDVSSKEYEYTMGANSSSTQCKSKPTVADFNNVIDYVKTKLENQNFDLFSEYRKKSWNELNKNNQNKALSSIPANMTFEELKKFLKILFEETNELLNADIKKRDGSLKKGLYIDYDHVSDGQRHKLMDSLNIKNCPYCNRQYITSYVKEKKNNTTADLDHYYQKALFPLFSMSVFNFIPSCHVCNSLMKGDKYSETLYPYEDSVEDDIKFDIILKNGSEKKDIVDIWLGKGKESFPEIKKISELNVINLIKGKNDAKKTEGDRYREKLIDNEIELFHLKEIYKNHLDQAVNVLLIMRIYLEEYFYTRNINSICKNIGITSVKNGTSITKEEIRSFLLGLVIDGQGEMDKPLAKMISDIYNNEVKNVSSNSIIEVNSIEEKILKLNIQDAIDLLRNSPLSEKDIIDLIAKKFEVAVEVVKKNYDEYYGD